MDNFVSGKKASEILGIGRLTLYRWEEKGKLETIRTPGGKRLYNVKKLVRENTDINKNKPEKSNNEKIRRKICYCRVSSRGQKDDLERQIKYMEEKYPNYEIISDIGSGLNYNRIGLKKIIDEAIEGKIEEIVIAYKDRLCRFGFEMIENIINKYSKGKITILNDVKASPEQELTNDLLQIMNVFGARMNGLRKYKKTIKEGIKEVTIET